MKIHVDKYKYFYNTMAHYVAKNKDRDLSFLISNMSTMSGIPVLAICYMYEKSFGSSHELTRHMEQVIRFYGYTEIVGKDNL